MQMVERAISHIMTTTTRRHNRLAIAVTSDGRPGPVARVQKRAERWPFKRLKAELQHAFAVPDIGYTPLTAAEVIARNEH